MSNIIKIKEVAMPIVKRHDCDLILLTFTKEKDVFMLRLLIERIDSDPDLGSGIDIGLCSSISRELGTVIEEENIIEPAYTLEVSSPGIERPLILQSDYERFANRLINIKAKQAIDGKKRFKGTLMGIKSDIVQININKDNVIVDIPFEMIAKANLVFDSKRIKAKQGDK